MAFPVDSIYEIREKGKAPVLIRITQSPLALHLIRVQEIESGKEDYLYKYINDNVEIRPSAKSDRVNITSSK